MKKKNLIILLIIPFIISSLTIVSVNVSYNLIDVDISHIQWGFDDIEAFKVQGGDYILVAEGVNQRNHKVSEGNNLVWKVTNKDESIEEPLAEIRESGGTFYLRALKQGEVILTCSNSKGTVSRSLTAILYKDGAVYISSTIAQSSYGKVDQTNYYGQFDFVNGEKVPASFNIQLTAIPASMLETITESYDGDIDCDFDWQGAKIQSSKAVVDGSIKITGSGEANVSLVSTINQDDISIKGYSIYVVENGINVYTFQDLMNCTNKSKEGEIAVLQRSFVPVQSKYASNEVCFGIEAADGSVDSSFVEQINTEYNHTFLDQWNKINDSSQYLDTKVNVALHVKKDMYGNGFMINFHNIAFPSQTLNGLPTTGPNDLFLGPLPFYTVGNPRGTLGSDMNNMNLISAYGQDNIGMYVDGDNLLLNDVVVKNCDDVTSLAFLSTVGTVVEVHGNNIQLNNCRFSNGRQVVRSFSNQNLTMTNCRLANARNFLFLTGSNEYVPMSENYSHELYNAAGKINDTLKHYLSPEGDGNKLLIEYLNGTAGTDRGSYASKKELIAALHVLQSALTDESVATIFKGSTEICDCTFYRSGISSIALETLFNGPFLLSAASPTNIAPFFAMLNSILLGTDFTPEKISGTSYPVKVNISGKTKFYDYKTWEDLDVSGLINESISTLVREFLHKDGYSIDDIFPIKRMLKMDCPPRATYVDGDSSKINVPIAFFGGGANYSVVTTSGLDAECLKHLNGATQNKPITTTPIDLLEHYMTYPALSPSNFGNAAGLGDILKDLQVDQHTLIKTVTLVTGYEPFQFVFELDGYLGGDLPSLEEMQQNALTGGNV